MPLEAERELGGECRSLNRTKMLKIKNTLYFLVPLQSCDFTMVPYRFTVVREKVPFTNVALGYTPLA